MKLIWAAQARKDRHEIFNFIKSSNPIAALELDRQFLETAQLLTNNPQLGRQGSMVATREFVVHRHYLLIYSVAGRTVRVLRVLHTSRQWPPSRP